MGSTTHQNVSGMEATVSISMKTTLIVMLSHPGLVMDGVMMESTTHQNAGGMGATVSISMKTTQTVMLIIHSGLVMNGVMVESTTHQNVGGMEATACSSMKTTQTVMLIIQNGLGMESVIMGMMIIMKVTIPPNVNLTEAIACKYFRKINVTYFYIINVLYN